MDVKKEWMLVKEDACTSPRSFPLASRSIKIQPMNRSFSEYRRARSQHMSGGLPTPPSSQKSRASDELTQGNFEKPLDKLDNQETSIERRFTLTEEYVRKEGTPTNESCRSISPSRSVTKMFERKISDLNKEIGRLEAENWTLRNERHETGKVVVEQQEKIEILLARQECLTKDLSKTMIELEDQKKITQTIKDDRDGIRRQFDVYLQKEITNLQQSECTFYCKTCDSKLFARSQVVSEVRSLNEGTSFIVKSLECEFTLGPQAVRDFPSLSKLFRVRCLYCDGCLKQIGYKFSSGDQIVDSESKPGESRYWIEGKYIESLEIGGYKVRRSLEDNIIKT